MSVVHLPVFVAVFVHCLTVVTADHPGHDALCPLMEMTKGPPIADTLVTSELSVDGAGIVQCGMQYRVPVKATLYQGMLAANKQHGDGFEFNSTLHQMWGHFISSINNVGSEGGFYWYKFDKTTLRTTPVGVDFIELGANSSYIWHYSNGTYPNDTYVGPCVGLSIIPPSAPLTYKVVYLTVSGTNVIQTTDNKFKGVCKQLVLVQSDSSSVFRLLEIANSQIPLSVEAELNRQESIVTSFSGIANNETYRWTGYKAGTDGPIPYDLSMTAVTDGDHILFRYEEVEVGTGPGNGAPSVGQFVVLLLPLMVLPGMTSVTFLLSKMPKNYSAVMVAIVLAVLTPCLTVVAGYDPCPAADMTSGPPINATLVTSYQSVDGPGMALCGMEYWVPDNATVYQGMLAAQQQHGSQFQFNSTLFAMYGHFINIINGISNTNTTFWFIFDNATQMLTPVGVDFLHITDSSSYIWQFNNSTSHNQTYTGPCSGPSIIYPTMSLTYKIAYLTISGANVPPNSNFKRVCKQLVLIPSDSTTAFSLLDIANSQIPLSVKALLTMTDYAVTSLNGVVNSENNKWIAFRAGTNQALPNDLSMTAVTDGDHVEFRYEETDVGTGPGNGAPSVGKSVAFLSLIVFLLDVVTSV
ncbi:uncharacterized protein LOC110973430 [Acanthaster planci]|uniref:Uncharacterized protein LOC110973430 n=1 Tax=Acanthaster planci TaxID=133434 RepID=A0A8B7XJ52_ACAPL|nr:uncharacterized protein LOC110973430 [Acanthaster planci]